MASSTQTFEASVKESGELLTAYDVLLVIDDRNLTRRYEIFEHLTKAKVTFCTPFEGGFPGQQGRTIFENVQQLLAVTTKVAFVWTNELKKNGLLIHVIQMVLQVRCRDTLMCLTENTCPLSPMLSHINNISMDHTAWLDNFVSDINCTNTEIEPMPVSYPGRTFSDLTVPSPFLAFLQESNQNTAYIYYELFGIKFTPKAPDVDVMFSSFLNAIEHHKDGTIRRACETFPDLVTKETRVHLNIDEWGSQASYSDFFYQFAKLMSSVNDLRISKELRITMYTVDGPILNEEFLIQLDTSIQEIVFADVLEDGIFCPLYADIKQRQNSFVGNWDEDTLPPVEEMVNAGFYRDEKYKVVWCFQCGRGSFYWPKDIDVLSWHAKTMPGCKYVKTICSQEFVNNAATMEFENGRTLDRFKDYNERVDSFSNLISFPKSAKDRKIMIAKLADAGFYYPGSDVFQCYSCGRVFSFVEITQQKVWPLHASTSPNCPHLLEKRGREYIEEIQAAREPNSTDKLMTITCFLKIPGVDRPWHKGGFQPT